MAELSVRVQLVEGSTSLATSRSHSVVVDRPAEKGGADLGFLGGELFLAGEGGCLLSTLVAAARGRDIALRRAEVQVRGIQAEHPPRFSEVVVEVELEADAGEEELDKLVLIAERGCIVSNTIRAGTPLTVRRRGAAPAAAGVPAEDGRQA